MIQWLNNTPFFLVSFFKTKRTTVIWCCRVHRYHTLPPPPSFEAVSCLFLSPKGDCYSTSDDLRSYYMNGILYTYMKI